MDNLKGKLLLILGPSIASTFLLLFTVLIAVFIVLGIFDGDSSSGSGGSGDDIAQGDIVATCDTEAAQLLAMIVYREVNGTSLFAKLNTASIVLNNAGGDSYEEIYALSDNTYANFSSYKNSSIDDVIPEANQGEFLYVAQVVLTGNYNLPSNMIFQASESIVTQYGTVWTSVSASPMDVYFGYSGSSLESSDVLGNSLPSEAYNLDSSVEYYTSLATTLEQSDYSSYTTSSICKSSGGSECGFTLKTTTLSKEEFRTRLEEYADGYSGDYKAGFQTFAENADNIYDIAVANNINPEVVVVRALVEGFSPAIEIGGNNYWGIGCTNTNPNCRSYSSFSEGVKAFVDNISQYSSLKDMMNTYSNIGEYWWNPGGSGIGGCYYAEHIYPNNMPDRVRNACGDNAPICEEGNTSNCTATTDEDQDVYSDWQVEQMTNTRINIFGEIDTSMCSPGYSSDVSTIINLSDSDAWLALTGTSTDYRTVSKSTMDSRMTTITVPIRVWSSSSSSDFSKEESTATLTVNEALAPLFTAFFNDIYNEATDFVIVPGELACYNYRPKTSSSSLSAHAYGAACDINWNTSGNEFIGSGGNQVTESEWNEMDESKSKYQVIYEGSKVVEIAHRYTLSWGGEWNSVTDAMHFSFIGDVTREQLQENFGGN